MTSITVLGILFEGVYWSEAWSYESFSPNLLIDLGQFKSPAVQRYIHELSTDMGEHLAELCSALSMFIEIGQFFF